MVDPHYKFTVVDIELYGRNNDEGICAHSKLQEYLETHLSIVEDKQLSGISRIAPEVIVDDKSFSINLTQDRNVKRTIRRAISIIASPEPGER